MSDKIEQKKNAALKLLLERRKSPSNPDDFLDFFMTNLKITYEFLIYSNTTSNDRQKKKKVDDMKNLSYGDLLKYKIEYNKK